MTVKALIRIALLPLLTGLLLAGCQPADQSVEAVWPQDVSDLPADPAVRYGQLDNGLRYAILVNQTPPNVASVRMVFNMGSLGENDEQRGIAHFIEHMAFNGSTHVAEGEMVPLLERHGLQFGPDTNAFTGRDTVGYQLDLPEVDEESIDTALFLMRETASELLLDPEAIDRERGVVLSEERFRNTAIRRWGSALQYFQLPGTLVPERDPIGTIETLETAQRDQFVDYYANFYVPQRGMIVVVGSVDPDAIEAKIHEVFGDWQPREDARPDPDLGSVLATRPFSVGYFNDPEVYTIFTVNTIKPYQARPDTTENRFSDNLANFGDAILSRRLRTIVNSGVSPLLQAGASHTSNYELSDEASVIAVATPDRWQEAVGVIEQELRRATEYGFTQGELDEQIANFRTSLQSSADQAATRESADLSDAIWSSWRGDQVYTTPASSLARFEASVDRVTLDAVNAAWREQWSGAEPLLFLATSEQIPDPEATIRAVWDASAAEPVAAPEDTGAQSFAYTDFGPAGTVAERTEIEDLGLVRLRFENGVAVTLKQTDFSDQSVLVRVQFGRGELEPRPVPVVDSMASSVFTASGLGAHSADDLARVLAGRSVGISFGVADDNFSFSAATTPVDFAVQMDVIAAFMTDPGWRAEGLAQYRGQAPEIRRNLYSSPTGILQAEVARMLHGGDVRYGFPDAEEVAGVDIAAMQAFLSPALENAPIEITIVGDISEEDATAAIAATFGALPARAASWPDYDEARNIHFPAPTTEPVTLRHNGPDYQAMANVYWPTFDDSDAHRTRSLSLLRAVFDLKLTERLREAEGFTYSAFNNSTNSDVYPDYGYLWVGVDVRVENVAATYAAIDELAAGMAAGDITDDEVLRARRPLLEQVEDAFESNGAWLNWLSQSWSKPERLDRIRGLTADYQSITRDELVDMAATYLRPQASWRVTILPRETE
ncbi:insulinase family protein [uncultured Maricaulis sp.]|uniref:M16 family metallopeptidase n=1 Tax=uncultured Maricaulis sp. TaxID=174710 RepID=UPI0030D70A29